MQYPGEVSREDIDKREDSIKAHKRCGHKMCGYGRMEAALRELIRGISEADLRCDLKPGELQARDSW